MARGSPGNFLGSGQKAKGIENMGSRVTIEDVCPYYRIFVEEITLGRKIDGRNTPTLL